MTTAMTRRRLSFGSQYKFPFKLFEVANDGVLIKWATDGNSVIVEQKDFEEFVMLYYPGFVQVKSFHNLRRLFRDYTFTFNVLRRKKPHGLKIEFRHPLFQQDKPNQLPQVRKKKRRRYAMHPLATSSPKNARRAWRRQRRSFDSGQQFLHSDGRDSSSVSVSFDTDELDSFTQGSDSEYSGVGISLSTNPSPTRFTFEDHRGVSTLFNSSHACNNPDVNNPFTAQDRFKLLQIFAKNELSESEFWELVTRRCGKTCTGKSWDTTLAFLDSVVNHELSPLHHNGFFYELSLDEL